MKKISSLAMALSIAAAGFATLAHADRDDLIEYVRGIGSRCRRIFLVHGAPEAAQSLGAAIRETSAADVTIPERGEEAAF